MVKKTKKVKDKFQVFYDRVDELLVVHRTELSKSFSKLYMELRKNILTLDPTEDIEEEPKTDTKKEGKK